LEVINEATPKIPEFISDAPQKNELEDGKTLLDSMLSE